MPFTLGKNLTTIFLIGVVLSLIATLVNIFMCVWLFAEVRNFQNYPTARLAAQRFSDFAGGGNNQGALTLFDKSSDKGYFEIGAYNFGWTLHTPHRIEFHAGKEVSIASYLGLPRFQVRNRKDTEAAIWINGENVIGSQFGPIIFALGSFNEGWKELARFTPEGDFVLKANLQLQDRNLLKEIDDLKKNVLELENSQVDVFINK